MYKDKVKYHKGMPHPQAKGTLDKLLLGTEMERDTAGYPVDRDTIVGDDTKVAELPNMAVAKATAVVEDIKNTEEAAAVNKNTKEEDRDRGTQLDKATIKVVENMVKVLIPKEVKVNKVASEIYTIINLTDLRADRAKDRGRGMDTIRCPLKVILKVITLRRSLHPHSHPPSILSLYTPAVLDVSRSLGSGDKQKVQ